MGMKSWRRSVMGMVVACAMVFGVCAEDEDDKSCVNSLTPCLNYLNGTGEPPQSCCDPLRWAIKSNPDCLCSLITKDGSNRAEQAGVDINLAQQLPARCGQHVNPLSCLTNTGSRDGVSNFAAATMSSTLQVTMMMAIMFAVIAQFLWPSNSPMSI